jgi:hypothetical protein
MFDRLTKGEKVTAIGIATLSLIGGIGAPFWIMGEMKSDIRTLRDQTIPAMQQRLDQLEKPRPTVALGDACVEMIKGFNDASDDTFNGRERQERYERQMQLMGCNALPALMAVNEMDAVAK